MLTNSLQTLSKLPFLIVFCNVIKPNKTKINPLVNFLFVSTDLPDVVREMRKEMSMYRSKKETIVKGGGREDQVIKSICNFRVLM